MRVIAIVLTAIVAICAVDPAFAAKKKSKPESGSDQTTTSSSSNWFQSSGCGIAGCYRSGSQKIQHHHHKSS
jgi:hypothetical protein